MTAFAPTVPSPNVAATADPEYTSYRWSRPIGAFEGNKASAVAIEGGAKALTETVNASDTLIKNTLSDSIEKEAGAKRDVLTGQLEQTLAGIRGDNGLTAYAQADASTDPNKKLDILTAPAKGAEVPSSVKQVGASLDAMAARRDNGSITETQYRGQIDALAKQYRNQWPGYKDYIDQEFDRVTERGVANDYIKSMVGDINTAQANLKEERGKTEGLLQHAMEVDHIPGADQWAAMYKSGQVDANWVNQRYLQATSWKNDEELAKAKITMMDLHDKENLKAGEAFVNKVGSNTVQNVFATLEPNLDKMLAETRNQTLDPVHGEQYAVSINSVILQAKQAAIKEAMITKGADGRTVFEAVGPDKFNDLLDKNPHIQYAKGIVDLLVGNKDHSLAALATNQAVADTKQKEWNLQSYNGPDPKITALSQQYNALKVWGSVGGVGGKLVSNLIEKNGMADSVQYWMSKSLITGGAQADANVTGDARDLVTMKKTYDEALANGVSSPRGFKLQAEKISQMIARPDLPDKLKEGYMQMAYDGENLKILEQLQPDHVDPQTGKMVSGRVWFYRNLTQENHAAEVARVAKNSGHPELWDKYQNYVEKAGEYLIGQETAPKPAISSSIGEIAAKVGTALQGTRADPDYNLTYSYDNEANKFYVNQGKGRPEDRQYSRKQLQDAQLAVDHINTVIKSVAAMSKYSGQDPNVYLYNTLGPLEQTEPRAAKMLQALIQSHQETETP